MQALIYNMFESAYDSVSLQFQYRKERWKQRSINAVRAIYTFSEVNTNLKSSSHSIVTPFHTFITGLTCFSYVYNVLQVPFEVAFGSDTLIYSRCTPEAIEQGETCGHVYVPDHLTEFYKQATDAAIVVNLIFKLIRGSMAEGYFITESGQTARRRSAWDMLSDLLSLVPVPEWLGGQKAILHGFSVRRTSRLLLVTKLPRMLNWVCRYLTEEHNIQGTGVLRMVWWSFFVSHAMGCMWLLISKLNGMGATSWAASEKLAATTIPHQYIFCLNWAFSTMIANGDSEPELEHEVWVHLMVSVLGTFVFAQIVAEVQNMLSFQKSHHAMLQAKREAMLDALHKHKVPQFLQLRVKTTMDLLEQNESERSTMTSEMEVKEMLDAFPDDLRNELLDYFNANFVKRVPFFQNLSDNILNQLLKALRPQVNEPQSYIIREGEPGTNMFFLMRGTVSVTKGNINLTKLHSGSYFGEMSLIFPETPRTANVVAVTYCDIAKLNKVDLDNVIAEHPQYEGRILSVAVKRFREQTASNAQAEADSHKRLSMVAARGMNANTLSKAHLSMRAQSDELKHQCFLYLSRVSIFNVESLLEDEGLDQMILTNEMIMSRRRQFLATLMEKSQIENYTPLQTLQSGGETMTHMCVLLEGEVSIRVSEQAEVGTLTPGSHWGSGGLVLDEPQSVTVVTRGHCQAMVVTRATLILSLIQYPVYGRCFLQGVRRRAVRSGISGDQLGSLARMDKILSYATAADSVQDDKITYDPEVILKYAILWKQNARKASLLKAIEARKANAGQRRTSFRNGVGAVLKMNRTVDHWSDQLSEDEEEEDRPKLDMKKMWRKASLLSKLAVHTKVAPKKSTFGSKIRGIFRMVSPSRLFQSSPASSPSPSSGKNNPFATALQIAKMNRASEEGKSPLSCPNSFSIPAPKDSPVTPAPKDSPGSHKGSPVSNEEHADMLAKMSGLSPGSLRLDGDSGIVRRRQSMKVKVSDGGSPSSTTRKGQPRQTIFADIRAAAKAKEDARAEAKGEGDGGKAEGGKDAEDEEEWNRSPLGSQCGSPKKAAEEKPPVAATLSAAAQALNAAGLRRASRRFSMNFSGAAPVDDDRPTPSGLIREPEAPSEGPEPEVKSLTSRWTTVLPASLQKKENADLKEAYWRCYVVLRDHYRRQKKEEAMEARLADRHARLEKPPDDESPPKASPPKAFPRAFSAPASKAEKTAAEVSPAKGSESSSSSGPRAFRKAVSFVASSDTPPEEPVEEVAPGSVPPEEPVVPDDVHSQAPVTSSDGPPAETATPAEPRRDSPVASATIPEEEPVVSADAPPEEPTTSANIPAEHQGAPTVAPPVEQPAAVGRVGNVPVEQQGAPTVAPPVAQPAATGRVPLEAPSTPPRAAPGRVATEVRLIESHIEQSSLAPSAAPPTPDRNPQPTQPANGATDPVPTSPLSPSYEELLAYYELTSGGALGGELGAASTGGGAGGGAGQYLGQVLPMSREAVPAGSVWGVPVGPPPPGPPPTPVDMSANRSPRSLGHLGMLRAQALDTEVLTVLQDLLHDERRTEDEEEEEEREEEERRYAERSRASPAGTPRGTPPRKASQSRSGEQRSRGRGEARPRGGDDRKLQTTHPLSGRAVIRSSSSSSEGEGEGGGGGGGGGRSSGSSGSPPPRRGPRPAPRASLPAARPARKHARPRSPSRSSSRSSSRGAGPSRSPRKEARREPRRQTPPRDPPLRRSARASGRRHRSPSPTGSGPRPRRGDPASHPPPPQPAPRGMDRTPFDSRYEALPAPPAAEGSAYEALLQEHGGGIGSGGHRSPRLRDQILSAHARTPRGGPRGAEGSGRGADALRGRDAKGSAGEQRAGSSGDGSGAERRGRVRSGSSSPEDPGPRSALLPRANGTASSGRAPQASSGGFSSLRNPLYRPEDDESEDEDEDGEEQRGNGRRSGFRGREGAAARRPLAQTGHGRGLRLASDDDDDDSSDASSRSRGALGSSSDEEEDSGRWGGRGVAASRARPTADSATSKLGAGKVGPRKQSTQSYDLFEAGRGEEKPGGNRLKERAEAGQEDPWRSKGRFEGRRLF